MENGVLSVNPTAISFRRSIDVTGALLACGAAVAPLFLGLSLIQVRFRSGFDLRRLAISDLSLGSLGWIQDVNFIVTGLLALACALGFRRALSGRFGAAVTPTLVAVFGAGCLLAGIFHPDPGLGFPPGAPRGMPATMSAHATIHQMSFSVGFLCITVCCFVMSRVFWSSGRRGWALYSALSGIATPLLVAAGIATPAWVGVIFVAAGVVGQGWISVVSARLLMETRGAELLRSA